MMPSWTGGDEHEPNLIRGVLWALVITAIGVSVGWALWKIGAFTVAAAKGWRP